MRKFLPVIIALFLLSYQSFGQNIALDVDVDNLYYDEPGCDDCNGNPDPRWRVRLFVNGSNFDWNNDRDEVCGFANNSNFGIYTTTSVAYNSTTSMQLNGFESDGGICFGDDNNCGSYATVNATATASASPPCQWNFFVGGRTCDIGYYQVNWSTYWSYLFSPVISAETNTNQVRCNGTAPSTLSATISTDANGRSLGRWYRWQISNTPTGPWVDVTGANNSGGGVNTATTLSFNPGQISGTRYYRLQATSNCGYDFGSYTATSATYIVTYAFNTSSPYSNVSGYTYATGDAAPAIPSGVCGSTVLPGQVIILPVLLSPNAGAAVNYTSLTWSASAGSPTSGSGTSFAWTAPTAAGNYNVNLTYNYGCSLPATVTCAVSVGSPDCNFAYVSASGSDVATGGGPNNPYATINYAVSQLGARRHIRVAGTITEPAGTFVNIPAGVTIEGGYTVSAGNWTKNINQVSTINSSGFESISGVCHRIGFKATTSNWSLIDLNIVTTAISNTDGSNRGCSNYGLWMSGASNYNVIRCNITSGTAANGVNGNAGGNGAGGNNGGGGSSGGCSDSNFLSGGGGGAGGAGACTGGTGGAGGSASANGCRNSGSGGAAASCGGGGGGGGVSANCQGCCSRADGPGGGTGTAGTAGTGFTAGDRPAAPGTAVNYYTPAGQSASGNNGTAGGGGGGGSSSSGERRTGFLCASCVQNYGNSGGGGGGGGGSGYGGTGGYGGGGSFAVYRTSSSTGANFVNVTLSAGGAGTGGNGGNGGAGGAGGAAGGGNNGCSGDRATSGAGGNGGAGGAGGRGRDGANGVSATFVSDGTITAFTNSAIVTTPTITIPYNTLAFCQNSQMTLSKPSGTWTLPSGLTLVNLQNNTTAGQALTDNNIVVNTTNSVSVPTGFNFTAPANVPSFLIQSPTTRAVPTITVNGASTTTICEGGTVTLASSGGTSPINYDWRIFNTDARTPISGLTSSLANPTINVASLSPGTYNIYYSELNQCCGWSTPRYTTFIVVADPVAPTLASSSPTINTDVCIGGSVSATITAGTGGAGCTDDYRVSTDGGSTWAAYTSGAGITVPNAAGSSIIVQGRRANSCGNGCDGTAVAYQNLATWSIIADPTSETAVSDPTICFGSTTNITSSAIGGNGTISAVNFERAASLGGPWTSVQNTSSTTYATPTNLAAGTWYYRSTVTQTVTGCAAAADATPVTLAVIATPTQRTVTASTPTICTGSSSDIVLTGSDNGVTYQLWNVTDNTFSATQAGTGSNLTFTTGALTATKTFKIVASVSPCADVNMNNDVAVTVTVVTSVPSAVTASANSLALCVGNSFNLNASGGAGAASWSWTGPNSYTNTNQDPAAFTTVSASAGNYVATATNVCGSTTSNTLTLGLSAAAPGAVTASANSLLLCVGNAFDLNASGGAGATSWSWSGPNSYTDSNQDPASFGTVAASAGNYTATATNACGSTSSSALALALALSTPSAVTASANSLSLCTGASFDLNASGGTGATSWSWSGPDSYTNSNQNPAAFSTSATSAGNYTATATNVCGSTSSSAITLALTASVPSAVTASANSLAMCAGSPFDLNATGGTGATSWSWSGPNGYGSTSQDPASFNTVAASGGNYIATATNVCGNATSNTLALAVTAAVPSAVTASATSANLCETQPLDLEATGGTGATSWSWTGPNSYSNSVQDPVSFITSSASTGNYVATATNICGSTVSNSLAVTVVTGPINKSVTSTTTICSGTSGTVQLVNSEPGTVYQLYNTTDNVNVGATQTGNGSTLSFSTGALASDKTYKIIGSRNPCTALDMNFGADVNVYVVTTGSWKGSLSDNWFDGGNWCLGGGIPTSSTDITIPTGSITDFDPVIASNGAVCRSINLNSGSIMTINNTRNLDVWGTWNNSGTFNYNVSTVTFKGTGNVILTGFTDPQEFYNLRVDKGTNITPLLSIETNTVVYGNLQPINGLAQVKADLELYNGPTIASTAGVEVTTDILQGNFRADGLNVTNNGLYSVISGTDSLNNLTNSSTATYTHAGGTSVLTGNVANTGATVTAAGGVLNVGGNWSNASSSTVTYSGATIAIVGDYSSSGSTVNANSATVSIGGKYTNSSSSTLSLGGAIVSVGGNYVSTGSSINQTGGAMTLNTTGASYNANAILDLDATSNLNISSGTIFFQRANGGTGNDLVIAAGGTKTITGGTFQFGNASTPASQVFKVNNSAVDFNNFNVNNSSSNNPRVQLLANAATRSTGVLTVDGVLDLNGYTFNVKNGATTGIVAGGYVISETSGGTSKLAWNIGNNTGTYVYPFGTAAGDFIPFTFSVTGAGVQSGAGNVTLSTYPTGDDNTPWVSGVQHMNFDQGPGNGTDATLDRWWIIDANNYTTRPTSNMTFKYASSDLSGNSSILEDNLKAQRWNATGGPDSLGGWDLPTEYGIVSTANAADNTVTASGVSRYSPWVLHDGESSGNSPLPIELVDFKASCTNDVVTINWTTATEINNDFFTVQRSADLATYDNVALVQGAGNSNTYRNYSAKDLYPLAGTAYYRLMQTDYNGEYEVFSPVTVSCVIKGSDVISVFPNPAQDRLNVSMNLSTSDRGRIMIYNHYGQLVESMFVEPKAGANIYDFDLGNLAQGQYFVSFSMENKVLPTQKVVITR